MRCLLLLFFILLFGFHASSQENTKQPNVVIILADDLALMDFGVYGGEASTPNIDALAANGAMFTQYRTSPLCSPSRAMLLTGIDNHKTGIATIPEILPKEHKNQPGYKMSFEPDVLTIADRLRTIGYRTLMTGKWHLGEKSNEMPQAHGFDRSFALAASGADNWEDKSYLPYYKDAPWFEDGIETDLPEDFYSSEFIVDKMIQYLDETDANKPFLAYLPFQAIHIPVQAPKEFIKKYEGRYDEGWDHLRQSRYERAKELGLFAPSGRLAPMPKYARKWDTLSRDDKRLHARRMEVNAAMIEAMDFHIGRFVAYLKSTGEYENTIFVVASDNGPEPSRGDNDWRLSLWMALNGYHVELENLGGRGSWGFIGPEWAVAAASPGALFKFFATEGGIRSPLIISGPGIKASMIHSPAMVTDITPTLLDWINVPSLSRPVREMTGRSLLPVLLGEQESVYGEEDIRVIEVSGNAALYKGEFKITRTLPPAGDGQWRLFNISADPGESFFNGAAFYPEVFWEMLSDYDEYAASMGVLEMPSNFDAILQVDRNTGERLLKRYWLSLLIILIAFIGFLWGLINLVIRLKR